MSVGISYPLVSSGVPAACAVIERRFAMDVPFLDVKNQYAPIRDEVLAAITNVVDNEYMCLCNGPSVRTLEAEISAYCDSSHGVAVSSGTDALLCSLMALGIGAGDEVITTPFTFGATTGTIARVGAKPVFVDIEPDTFNIDASKIEAAITDKTKAIMPVHLYGQVADMDEIMAIAQKHNLHVIEDAAQVIGATYKGRKAGSFGTTGCFSFYPTKNLGAMGDGGLITTQDDEVADKLERTRNHGQTGAYIYGWVGGNFRMDSMLAAVLSVKFKQLEGYTARRIATAAKYDELLADCDGVITPTVREHNKCIFNQYTIRVPNRDDVRAKLGEKGVPSVVYYPLSMHQQPCFASLGYSTGDFPESEKAAAEVLSLPIEPELSDEQISYVAETIKSSL